MSFSLSGLYQVGPGGVSPRLWMYSTLDPIADVNTEGYFNDASDLLDIRDVIFVCDTNVPSTTLVNVLSNAAGVVDVSDGLTVPETDGD